MKPLGHKAYGSIPHLPESRLGPGDYSCHEGQAAICLDGVKGRNDRVIVTEKLDGSNVAIAKINGEPTSLIRSGYLAQSSPRRQHQVFAAWVRSRNWTALPDGFRVCGEWMYQAHGTMYVPDAPFIAFDVFNSKNKRIPHDDARALMAEMNLVGAAVISDGPPLCVSDALSLLGDFGKHGATELIEGAVWRVETAGQFNFMAKFVRHEKQDGKYFGAGSDGNDIFMCDPMNP